MENDFITDENLEIDVNGRKFLYRPCTALDEIQTLTEIKENKEKDLNLIHAEKLLKNIVGVPYNKEIIKSQIKVEKEWEDLSKEERINFLFRLKKPIFSELCRKISQIESEDEQKKNSV